MHSEARESNLTSGIDVTETQQRYLFRLMLMQRTLGHRGFQLNRQGKIPFAAGSEGHEAVQAGAALAFRRGSDILVPYYRDIGLAIGVGLTPLSVMTSLFARAADSSGGRQFPNHYTSRELGIFSISSIVAAHCAHAAGAAYALKLNGTENAVLCTFGEGATSHGEWHESVNFAAVHRLPIVWLCENNGWAISVPQSQQMAVENVADKAIGYGMPGETIDGFDPIATYAAVDRALQRARRGEGPTLIEATCYRFLAHTTDDDDRTYRTREEVDNARLRDPIPRFERQLLQRGVMDVDSVAQLKAEILAEVNAATDEAEALASPSATDMYANVYEGTHEPWM